VGGSRGEPFMHETRTRQSIRYLRTPDGVRLAWAESGRGPTLVKAANWLTHLELEWESPVWRHWIRFFAGAFRFVRYDERGCGMTDWNVGDLGVRHWVNDLEAVVDVAVPSGPMALLGVSQGAAPAIEFAVRHPERVSHLILYGGYAQGWRRRGDEVGARHYESVVDLIEQGWGGANPVFRQLFTSRFIPGGNDQQLDWFNELCVKTTSPQNAAALLAARAEVDVRSLLGQVRVPTLVLHARLDEVVPIVNGRILAAEIPHAEFVELDSANHILLDAEPAWERFCDAIREFTGVSPGEVPAATGTGADAPAAALVFAALSPRERQVLVLLTEGRSNAEIATRLAISDKTVRNHVSNLFDKLGVWSRAQAIVFARDHGFRPGS
jgi:pimeloyl-ACP methyl ester carboxylesterase/DNA-binding CsgD family transcriptional regulator